MTLFRSLETIKHLNFKVACRICLDDNESTEKYSIIDIENGLKRDSIKEKLYACCGVFIEENDALPSKICSSCMINLNGALSFIRKCKDSEDLFRQYKEALCINATLDIKPIKEEFVSSEVYSNIESLSIQYHSENSEGINEEICLSEPKLQRKRKECSIKTARKRRKELLNREILNAVKKQIQCESCGLAVQSQSALIIHERTHSGEKPYDCSYCDKAFAQKSTLRMHITRRHMIKVIVRKKQYECEICHKSFTTLTNLKIHIRIHTGECPYECKFCSKRFMQLGTLISHKRRHLGEKPYSCNLCGKAFVEKNHLRRHQSVHSADKPYVCNVCGKGLKSTYALKQHIKLHDNTKEHICDQCGVCFSVKGNLDAHQKVVHSEKSGQCLICNKICSDLDDHMINHTGEKKYQCEVCNKRFAHKRGLVVHSRQHTEANKFQCTFKGCNKSFYAQWVLDCHISKHTGYTPFTCKYCSKGFLRICHLNKHLKLNHSVGLMLSTPFSNKDKSSSVVNITILKGS